MKDKIKDKLSSEYDLKNIVPMKDGGQSHSFKSYDPILNRDVFVKVYWFSDKYSDTLLAEPRRLSTLFSSNVNCRKHIANIYDVNKIKIDEDEYLVLQMEYCGNNHVGDYISNSGLSIQESINYAKQLCEGLHFLHSVNILHRDIKPENLIVNEGICKLIDFGSTTMVDEKLDYTKGTSIKTLNYTPPEFFGIDSKYGKYSDIYQIGVVLHEMLNGRIFINTDKLSSTLISRFEKQIGKKYKDFGNWDMSEFEKKVIEYLSSKNQLLTTFAPTKKHIPNSLTKLIRLITDNEISKRPNSCVSLRNMLSNIVVPNWKMISESEYTVTKWKDKDYRIKLNLKKENKWILESAKHLSSNFKQNHKFDSLDSIIKFINEQ